MLRVDPLEFFASLGVDLIVVALLAFVLFYRRHRDREMAVAIAAINITLWALTGALASYTLSLGVGFALFAVISVIRLRSTTASWISMAYLLVGLGSGLISGLTGFSLIEKIEYSAFLVFVMAIVGKWIEGLFNSPKEFLKWNFVVMAIPGFVLHYLDAITDEPNTAWKTSKYGRWLYRIGGVVVFGIMIQVVKGVDIASWLVG